MVLSDPLPQVALDVALDGEGRPVVIGHRTNADGTFHKAILWRLTPEGLLTDSLEIAHPGSFTYLRRLYHHAPTNTMLATGMVSDTFPDLGMAQRTLVAEVNGNEATIAVSGPVFRSATDGLGFIDVDGSLAYGVAYWDGGWLDLFHFHTVRYCPGEGFCGGGPYAVMYPFDPPLGRTHVMARVPSSGIVGVSPTELQECWSSGSAINQFSDNLELQACLPIQPIDSFYWGLSYHRSSYIDQYGLLPLSSGNMLLCGMYDHSPSSDVSELLVAVEKVSPDGQRRAIRDRFDSEVSEVQRPAFLRSLSPFNEQEFVFAFFDDSFYNVPVPEPFLSPRSNVHIVRMDTALNILGEHVFNGRANDRWHNLQSVVAAPDGSAYVVGSVYDYKDPSPRPKAWIARVAAGQFVSVPEDQRALFTVFPNPGRDAFQLELEFPMEGARINIHDTQGRLIHSHTMTGQIEQVATQGLRGGLYMVSVADRYGTRWAIRWMKE